MKATIALAVTLLLASPGARRWQWPWSTQNAAQSASSALPTDSRTPSGSMADSDPPSSPTSADAKSASSRVADSTRSVSPAIPADPSSQYTPGPDYVIGLGDVLRISVWKEGEFSSTVQVRSDGMISLPLLNDVQAVGYKPMDLAASLAERLKKYVDDPRVTIIVSQARPPVFYLVGEVGHHGPMALAPNMTVFQALVTAGLSTFANAKKIYVLRVENGIQEKLPVNYKRMVQGKMTKQNIALKPGDVVVVP